VWDYQGRIGRPHLPTLLVSHWRRATEDVVANPTRLIEFLRNNEAVDFSGYQGDWHRRIGQWTADGLERAAAAARSNTSLAALRVNVAIVADEVEVDRIAAFLENFRCVSHLEITNEFDGGDGDDDNADRGGGRGAHDVGEPRAVDKILLGMCRSESPVSELTLTCSGGWAAVAEFAKRFPGITRLNLVGGPRGGGGELMRLSNDFAHGLAAAIGTQWRRHHLSHLRHHVTGELRDVARITAAVGACPRLASPSGTCPSTPRIATFRPSRPACARPALPASPCGTFTFTSSTTEREIQRAPIAPSSSSRIRCRPP
jgi:hypothetical protein